LRRALRWGGAAAGALLALASPSRASACAIVEAPHTFAASIALEDALIVWDEARQTEHFIRSALFDTRLESIGFLVPTPSPPALAEASDSVFPALERITAPQIEIVQQRCFELLGFTASLLPNNLSSFNCGVKVGAPPRVSILGQETVADVDATTLAASDTSALAGWLGAHGFAMRDGLRKWLDAYVRRGSSLVAFRYPRPTAEPDGESSPPSFASRAIRISFHTPAPVYPYFEPEDAAGGVRRGLRVYVVAERPMNGELEGGGAWETAAIVSSVPTDLPAPFREALPGVDLPAQAWVTLFFDAADKRPPVDLVFHPAAAQPPVRRLDVRQSLSVIYVPYELIILLPPLLWWWRRRRRAARA
jgi:hypothetical protein